ncbi:hypothetical protein [Maribellus maritimus]|uniref:hypothetical protein n=1 Tax=Maribellus maritimus TaxID=2870838 RepID=UPI001EECBE04|nr:hypothetical protein [Maribellus maritimus]MCG6186399.1 hypothetical protein [Maribellus maritimus]
MKKRRELFGRQKADKKYFNPKSNAPLLGALSLTSKKTISDVWLNRGGNLFFPHAKNKALNL